MSSVAVRVSPETAARQAVLQTALDEATKTALLEHARMGRTVPVTAPDGTTRQAEPAEIFARYGLDEFGRPQS